MNYFYLTLNFSSDKCKKKIKLNFDVSVFDNWTQEIFVLSIDNIPDDEELPQKVNKHFDTLMTTYSIS